jgi:hypothetical protein
MCAIPDAAASHGLDSALPRRQRMALAEARATKAGRMIDLWYYEGGPHPDPPDLVGTYDNQKFADSAAETLQRRMTNPQFPYRMWAKEIKTLLQEDSKSEMEVNAA